MISDDRENPMDVIKADLEKTNSPAGIGEPHCLIHRANHSDCRGCQTELGCCKLSGIGLLLLQAQIYQPKSFIDSMEMTNTLAELSGKILDATSVEEVRSLTTKGRSQC
jgi:hypothetical protein